MATNLVSFIMQFLTPDVIARIADALGLDRGSAHNAIGAAVPALLAGLSGVAAQPGGAQKLADAAQQHSGALDNLSSMITGGAPSGLAETGTRMLSSLFGGGQNALIGPIARAAGLSAGEGSSLIGMLAPVVMGAIAKQQGGRIDAGGISGLLASQKDNIMAALPSGLRSQLQNTGLLDALGGVAGRASAAANAAASDTARAASYATQSVADAGSRAARAATSNQMNWVVWALPIAAICALILYYLTSGTGERVAETTTLPPPPAAPARAVQSVTVGGVDVGKQVGDTLASLRTSLQDIKDEASAQANLPRLQQVTTQMDNVRGTVEQLTPDQRKVIAGIVKPSVPVVNRMFDNVLAIPGVNQVLKPTVDTLKTQLATLDSGS